MPVALSTLRTAAQGRADMESDGNVASSVWNTYINGARRKLRVLMVQANPQQFLASASFTLSGSTYTYDLSANVTTFWKALALDKVNGAQADQIERVPRFLWAERMRAIPRSYRIYSATLEIRPASSAAGDYALWYIQQPATLSADGDTLLLVEDMWQDYITIEAAIRARKRQRRDTADLVEELREWTQMIKSGAMDNDVGEPDRVLDVYDQDWTGRPRLPPP